MGILRRDQSRHHGGARPDGKPFNPYHLTDAELEETKKLLIAQKKLLLTRYQDYDALDRLMRGGAVWAAPEFAETYRHLTVLRSEGKIDFDVQHVLKPEGGRPGLGRYLDDQRRKPIRSAGRTGPSMDQPLPQQGELSSAWCARPAMAARSTCASC